jgi:hypothetical protein
VARTRESSSLLHRYNTHILVVVHCTSDLFVPCELVSADWQSIHTVLTALHLSIMTVETC